MVPHNCMFEWEQGSCGAFGVRQRGERIMREHTFSSDSFTHNWVIHKHGVMELQPDLKCLTLCVISSSRNQWAVWRLAFIHMSRDLNDELLIVLLFLYFFQKPVRASAEEENTFSSNLWARLGDCGHLWWFFFPNCCNYLLPNVQIRILEDLVHKFILL